MLIRIIYDKNDKNNSKLEMDNDQVACYYRINVIKAKYH